MDELRNIEIDLDVNKEMEKERASFSEAPNDILRRKYGLPARKEPKIDSVEDKKWVKQDKRGWSGQGVSLQHGTLLAMDYNYMPYTGRIDDGAWLVDGQRYSSPSGAMHAAKTKKGQGTRLNGWNYWRVKRPVDTSWIKLDYLRSGGESRKTILTLDDL